jgi:hypothetical protein
LTLLTSASHSHMSPKPVMMPIPGSADAPSRRHRIWLVAGLLLCPLAACATWEVQGAPRPEAEEARYVERARVTVRGGDVMVLEEVQVRPDSVVGWRRARDGALDQVAIARSEVRIFEARRVDTQRSILAAIGGVLAVAAGVFAVAFLGTTT